MRVRARPLARSSHHASRLRQLTRRVLWGSSTLGALALLSACGGGDDPTCTVSGVSVSPASAALTPGGTSQLSASINASNCNPAPSATWSSSAPSVATVSPTGLVTGVSVGSATISATAAGSSGTASISVAPAPIATLTITPATATTAVGGAVTLAAEAKDAAGNALTGRTITWASLSANIATVSAAGVVTGVAAGSATITASAEGRTAVAVVTVTPPPVASVSVTLGAATLTPGQRTQAVAVTTDAAGATLAGRTIGWQSSNSSVATVDASGSVTAVAAGTTTITATSEGKSGSATLTVTPVPVANVTVSAPSASLSVGSTMQASVTLTDANGIALTRPVVWSSSNTNTASVSASGLITAISAGPVTISVQSEGKTGNLALTILGTPTLSLVSVTPANGATNQSIETSVVVTFSEDIDAATVTSASVALTASGSVVAATRTVSGKVLTIKPSSLLPENTAVALAISTAVKSSVGNTLPATLNRSFGVALLDPNYFYRFFNNLTGQTNSLDTFSNTFQGFMGPTGPFSGQFWYATPIAGSPGNYVMRNAFKGDNWYLEGTDGVAPVELQNTAPNVFTGQSWRFVGNAFGPGCFSLQNANFGSSKSMANVNGSVIMQPTAAVASQCWSIARIARR